MTISNETIKVTVQGNGVQTTFNYNFLIPSASAAELYLLDTTTGDSILLPAASWQLNDAGNPAGGTFIYPRGAGSAPASATQALTLVRTVPYTQQTNLANQNGYYPRAVESALDWIVMQVQQFVDETSRALRVPIQEQGIGVLPPAAFRRNTIQAWDSAGAPTLLPIQPDNNTTVIAQGGATARTLAARFADVVNVLDHGAVPDWDGTTGTDNTAAFSSAFAYAALMKRMVFVPYGDFYAASPLWLHEGALGIMMQGTLYSPGGFVALTVGGNGATRNQNKLYGPIRVRRTTQSNWSTESDIGVRIWNVDGCVCVIARAERFCINVQLASDLRGVEDSDFHYGRIIDGKIGVDLRTYNPGPNSYVNSCRHFGGHFACSSTTNPGVNRFGVRLSRNAPGDYDLHNSHTFYSPAFELQTAGGHQAIPFRVEVDGRALAARGIRMESCSPYVAEHTSAFNDAYYEIDFVGTYGTLVGVRYSGATRAGATIRNNHQALSANNMPKLVAANENIRASAFRAEHQASGGIGFDGMGVMAAAPSGNPTTMSTLIFSGLPLFALNPNDITIPTSRALGFVVDVGSPAFAYGIPKEIFIAAEGSELRPVVAQFDAAENALSDTSPILFSNANAVWNGAPSYWWEMNTNLDHIIGGYPLVLWQSVTLHPNCRFAFIGVRGGSATARLKALRLFSGPLVSPQVLAGGVRDWGSREMQASAAWTVPPLGAGATAAFDITVPGLRGGDFVQASFDKATGFQNGGVVFHAVQGGIGSANQVRVTAQNITGGTVTVGDGTLYVRGLRPRI